MSIIDYIDRSHLLDYISKIPISLITEIIVIIFCINLLFAFVYYQFYKNDKTSFKNIHNLESDKPITFYDFIYFSHTLFFSLGYDIIPQNNLVKLLTMIHLKMGFIITAIYISKIISSF